MSRRTAGPEAVPAPASRPSASPDRKSRSIRWILLALGAAYVAASLGGFRLDAVAPGLAYLPPIAGFVFMAAFFGATLRRGSEPLVGRVARREHPHLTPELARYTRRLTLLWAASFAALAAASLVLAALVSYLAWSRWTHGLALGVPAALFFGEYLHRIRRYPSYAHAAPARLFVNIVRVVRDTATRSRAGTLPLLQCRSMSDAFLLGHGPTVVAGQFLGQAQALARALPESAHVINVCGGRHAFLVAFGAALIRGQVSLLPPGHARGDWERLLAAHPGATLLGDERPVDAPASWLDVTPWLANDAYANDVPSIEAERTAAILFTSGSTGDSVGHAKTWGQLWNGARTWADALGWGDTHGLALVGSVPPQHMFGLEATVMLALYAGVPVHTHRPLLPADVAAALDRDGRTFWWMTTPIHLRATLASSIEAPRMAGIVSSTMSLPPPAARAAEARWKVPVIEVYGSTETGALATRRTATEEQWRPLPDVVLRPSDGGVVAEGPRIGAPIRLGDLLEFAPDGRFLWRGRVADLVKVAGRRASLAALERRLQEIDGMDDAAFFVPDAGGDEVKRLAAFYVSSTLEPEAVLEALRPALDAVFLPRPLFRVARLPRNANGKLTRAALSELHEACHSPERFTIGRDHPAIAGHFPGNPLVPGAVILARVAQAIGARFPGRAPGTIASARFVAPLAPGQPATIEAKYQGNRVAFEVKHGEALLATGTWRME
jgi:uncharacterized membrane protein